MLKSIASARANQQLFVEEPDPTKRQIAYLISKYCKHGTKPIINMGDLIQRCDERIAFPSNYDDAFIIGHECSTQGYSQSFRFCISTPNLLEKFSNALIIAIDATYKLNRMGYPLIMLFPRAHRGLRICF